MLAKKQGVILSMSSIAGFVAGGGGMAYTMSKHVIVGFIKQLALDWIKVSKYVAWHLGLFRLL